MTMFWIKIVAFVTMIIDHIQYRFEIINNMYISSLGRLSFPLFAFMIGEGYTHTKDLKKYFSRLFILALISQIPYVLFTEKKELNILFTLIFGLCAIIIYNKVPNKFYSAALIATIIFLGKILKVDYGMYGVAIVFILYLFRDKKILLTICYALTTFIYYYKRLFIMSSTYNLVQFIYTLIPIIIILLYRGKLGKRLGYWVYVIYPIHMLVMYLMDIFIIK